MAGLASAVRGALDTWSTYICTLSPGTTAASKDPRRHCEQVKSGSGNFNNSFMIGSPEANLED